MNKEIKLSIKGMTCAACANRIEKKLQKTEGIIDSSVNLATEKAKIKYIDSLLNERPFKILCQSVIRNGKVKCFMIDNKIHRPTIEITEGDI